jgi:hypothetical protein
MWGTANCIDQSIVRATTALEELTLRYRVPHHHADRVSTLCNLKQNTKSENDRTNCRGSCGSARGQESRPGERKQRTAWLNQVRVNANSRPSRSLRAGGQSFADHGNARRRGPASMENSEGDAAGPGEDHPPEFAIRIECFGSRLARAASCSLQIKTPDQRCVCGGPW